MEQKHLVRQPLTVPAALLQALHEGPAYGAELIRRFERRMGGHGRLAPGRVYPALTRLRQEGLVTTVRVAPGGRRGARARIYYGLSPKGLEAATRDRKALLALLAPRLAFEPLEAERSRMVERLLEAEELSEAAAELAASRR